MQRNFSADISIKVSKESKNVVSIIPFSDRDRFISKKLETILNQSLSYDGDIDFGHEDGFRRLTQEIR